MSSLQSDSKKCLPDSKKNKKTSHKADGLPAVSQLPGQSSQPPEVSESTIDEEQMSGPTRQIEDHFASEDISYESKGVYCDSRSLQTPNGAFSPVLPIPSDESLPTWKTTSNQSSDNPQNSSPLPNGSAQPYSSVTMTSLMPLTAPYLISTPGTGMLSALILPVDPRPQPRMLPPVQFTSAMVEYMSPEMVLWVISHYVPGVMARLPPFRNENREIWRALVIDNIPSRASQADVLRLLKPRGLESIKHAVYYHNDYDLKRHHTLLTRFELRFLDFYSALTFYAESMLSPILFDGELVEANWIMTPAIEHDILDAVEKAGATRILRVHFQPVTEIYNSEKIRSQLWETFGQFGIIENMSPQIPHWRPDAKTATNPTHTGSVSNAIQRERPISWTIHFISIEAALRAKLNSSSICRMPHKYPYESISFNQDTSTSVDPLKKQAALLYLGESPYNWQFSHQYSQKILNRALAFQSLAAVMVGALWGDETNIGNRCICLSKLPPLTKMQDVCNTVRGGMLESIKLVSERNVCFVTFLEPTAAAQFWAAYQVRRLSINSERVRVGWGRHSGPLASEIMAVVARGVTRNLCIRVDNRSAKGPLSNLATDASRLVFDDQALFRIFSPFGYIEQVRIAPEVGCSFVSFADISSALQAADWARETSQFPGCEVKYGKDRCAATSRQHYHSRYSYHEHAPVSEDDVGSRSVLVDFLRRELPLLTAKHSMARMPVPIMPMHVGAPPHLNIAHAMPHTPRPSRDDWTVGSDSEGNVNNDTSSASDNDCDDNKENAASSN